MTSAAKDVPIEGTGFDVDVGVAGCAQTSVMHNDDGRIDKFHCIVNV